MLVLAISSVKSGAHVFGKIGCTRLCTLNFGFYRKTRTSDVVTRCHADCHGPPAGNKGYGASFKVPKRQAHSMHLCFSPYPPRSLNPQAPRAPSQAGRGRGPARGRAPASAFPRLARHLFGRRFAPAQPARSPQRGSRWKIGARAAEAA